MKKRYLEIDILRGIAIFSMILIHTSYYFLNNKAALITWNWGQFAVPVLIFCSSYIFFQKNKNAPVISLSYFKKRITRLLYPYFIFLIFFLTLVLLFTPEGFTTKYVVQSILLTGGVSINWLVLLFIHMTIIFPLILMCFKQYKPILIIYAILSIASSCLFMFHKSPISNKDIMWLPWSVIPLFTLFFVLNEHKKNFMIFLSFISGLVFIISYYLVGIAHQNPGMYENKYPPTIYFLSFGTLMISLLYLLSKHLIRKRLITKLISFFSLYSYSIFFIHYTILVIMRESLKYVKFNWITFSLTLILITVTIQIGINRIKMLNTKII